MRTYEFSRVLSAAVTEYDRKELARAARRKKNGYHNAYALPQYFAAIDRAENGPLR